MLRKTRFFIKTTKIKICRTSAKFEKYLLNWKIKSKKSVQNKGKREQTDKLHKIVSGGGTAFCLKSEQI
jgi:hypothetical protein